MTNKKCFSCLPTAILNNYLGLANSYTLLCDRGITVTPAYWIIVALVKKKWNDSFKLIRHSQNWDLSHNIIIIVLLECHHTKTIACHLFAEISRKKYSFYMLQDNKCVLNCLYFYIRTYTDVFYMYCISFRFDVYLYISVPIYVLSWLWILVLIAVFFVSNLMYCFINALSGITKYTSYIYIIVPRHT